MLVSKTYTTHFIEERENKGNLEYGKGAVVVIAIRQKYGTHSFKGSEEETGLEVVLKT